MRTGRDNADSFIKAVLSSDDSIIIEYGDNWPWMKNALWRKYVITNLTLSGLKTYYFSEPDELDGWTFTAYRAKDAVPISRRNLDDPEQ